MTPIPGDVVAAAQGSARSWRVPASVTIAQWALESGWGQHMPPGSNNPFGIKARDGDPSVAALTREFIAGRYVVLTARFRAYPTLADAFDDHAQIMADNPSYDLAFSVLPNAESFAKALTGIYATDPRYGDKLVEIMRDNNLAQYD